MQSILRYVHLSCPAIAGGRMLTLPALLCKLGIHHGAMLGAFAHTELWIPAPTPDQTVTSTLVNRSGSSVVNANVHVLLAGR